MFLIKTKGKKIDEWTVVGKLPGISGLLSFDTAGATGLSFVLVELLLDLMRRSASTYFDPDVGRFLRFNSAFKSLTVTRKYIANNCDDKNKSKVYPWHPP